MCPMCHAFSFSIDFSSVPLPSSFSLCIWFSLLFPLPTFLCLCTFLLLHFHPAPSPLSSVFPAVSFSDPTFPSISLPDCNFYLPPLSHLLLILSCLAGSTPHNLHPVFHGKVCLLFFPSPLKPFPDSSSKKESPSCTNNSIFYLK